MKKEIHITLAEPRGFCAGVDRAIAIVEKALEKYGSPIYVRHEVVHNEFVIEKDGDFDPDTIGICKGSIIENVANQIVEKSWKIVKLY